MEVVASLDIAARIVALQRVPMFSAVAVSDLERLAAGVVERRYEPLETVFARGDWEDDMIMVVDGEVTLCGDSGVVIATRGPGEHFGEVALLRHEPRSLTAVAGESGMRGLVVDCRTLESMIEERPQIATAMLRTLADILADIE